MAKNADSKYLEVAGALRQRITNGDYYGATLLPSENELCAQYDVSRVTAREALSLLEKEGLVERRHGLGSFVPDSYYRYRGVRNRRIGMITYDLKDEVFTSMEEGMREAALRHGFELVVVKTQGDSFMNKRKSLLQMLDADVDGVIIDAMMNALPTPNADVYERYAASGIPVVFTNGYHEEVVASRVMADDAGSMERMVDLLVSLGHQRIGGIFASVQHQGLGRYQGYINGLRKHGLAYDDGRVLFSTLGELELLFDTQLRNVQHTFLACTAIICYNDAMARYLENTLFRMGIYVPGDISVTGMDGMNLPSPTGTELTSITHPQRTMGMTAVEVLLETLRTHHLQPNVTMPTELIPGATVGAPRQSDEHLLSAGTRYA